MGKEENTEVYKERKKALIALVQNTVRSSNLEVPKWMQPVAGEKIVMGRWLDGQRKKALNARVQNNLQVSNQAVPEWMQPVAGEKIVVGRNFATKLPHMGLEWNDTLGPNVNFAMKLPHMGLKWNDTLGPNAYGEMGPLSKYFMTQLKRDCQPDENGPE
eukprot:gene11664-34374_t